MDLNQLRRIKRNDPQMHHAGGKTVEHEEGQVADSFGREEILELKVKNRVPFLSFPALERTGFINHGFSTRLGGVSQGIYSSMNLSFTRGDAERDVRENFHRIAGAIGFNESDLVFTDQTHTANIRIATADDRGKGFSKPMDYNDVDGLITNIPGIALAAFYADCVPLFLADPVHKAIGLVHSGWKGTVGKIGIAVVEAMTTAYGTDPDDLIAAIGPSICRDCYEVSHDVAEEFRIQFEERNLSQLLFPKENGKYLLDLWRANDLVLQEAGVPKAQITVTDICTCCNQEFLFSHRASHGKRGNLGAFMAISQP